MATGLLAQLNTVADAAAKATGAASDQIVDLYGDNANLSQVNANLQTSIGTSNQIIAAAQASSDLKQQQARLTAASQFGTDVNSQTYVLGKLAQDQIDAYTRKQDASAKIAAGDAMDPFAKLLWEVSGKANDLIQQHNDALEDQNSASSLIQNLQVQTSNQMKIQNDLTTGITAASIAANDKKIADTAAINANDSLKQTNMYNIEALKASVTNNDAQLKYVTDKFSAQKAEQAQVIALAGLKLHQDEFAMRVQEHQEKTDYDKVVAEAVRAGADIIGGPGTSDRLGLTNSAGLTKAVTMAKSGNPTFQAYMKAGLSVNPDGTGGIVATSPADTLALMTGGVRVGFTGPQSMVPTILNEALEQASKPGTTWDPKNPKGNAELINAKVKEIVKTQLADVEKDPRNSLFNIGDIKTLFSEPQVASLPLVNKVLAPLSASGIVMSSPDKVFSAMADAVAAGTIPLETAAANYASIYARGVDRNLATKNLVRYGITGPSDPKNPSADTMRTYNSRVTVGPGVLWDSQKIVNNTNEDSVKAALSRNLAARMTNRVMANYPTFSDIANFGPGTGTQ